MNYDNPEFLRELGKEHLAHLIAVAEQERFAAQVARSNSQWVHIREDVSDRVVNWGKAARRVALRGI